VLRLSCRRLCTYLQCLDNLNNLIVCINVHGLTELNLLGNVALCWTVVWKIFPVVESLDPDKQVRFACQRRSYLLALRIMSLGAVQHLYTAVVCISSVIAHLD
jgi:hypothetical protein